MVEVKKNNIHILINTDAYEHRNISSIKTLLDLAVQFDKLDILKYFISLKKNPTTKTLYYAMHHNNINIGKSLLTIDIINLFPLF